MSQVLCNCVWVLLVIVVMFLSSFLMAAEKIYNIQLPFIDHEFDEIVFGVKL